MKEEVREERGKGREGREGGREGGRSCFSSCHGAGGGGGGGGALQVLYKHSRNALAMVSMHSWSGAQQRRERG